MEERNIGIYADEDLGSAFRTLEEGWRKDTSLISGFLNSIKIDPWGKLAARLRFEERELISPLAANINYQIMRAKFLKGAVKGDYPELPEEEQVLYHSKLQIAPDRLHDYILDLPEIIEDATTCNQDAVDQFRLTIEDLDVQDRMLLDVAPKYDWIRDIFDPKNDPGRGSLYPMYRRESDGRVRYQEYPHLDYRNRTGIR